MYEKKKNANFVMKIGKFLKMIKICVQGVVKEL